MLARQNDKLDQLNRKLDQMENKLTEHNEQLVTASLRMCASTATTTQTNLSIGQLNYNLIKVDKKLDELSQQNYHYKLVILLIIMSRILFFVFQ